jgi:hypothetical protein
MSTGLDIGALLAFIAEQDGRDVGVIDVAAWSEQAIRGNWSKQDAFDAVMDFYAQERPPCWPGTDQPRPVLPADINAFIARKGRA